MQRIGVGGRRADTVNDVISLLITAALLLAVALAINDAASVDWGIESDLPLRQTDPMDVRDEAPVAPVSPPTGRDRATLRRVAMYAMAIVVPVLVVVVLVPWRDDVSVSLALSLQLLVVVTIAAVGGLWPGLVAAVAAPMLVNWFLVPPYESFHIGDRQNEITLVVFLAAAGAVSAFVSYSAARAARSERARVAAETAALEQSDELRGALLRAVSHDLRTPLAGIKAAVSSLREPDIEWSDTDRRDFLETIEANTDRLTGIITNLLDLSKLQAGTVEPTIRDTALGDVVAAALDSIDAGADVEIDLPDGSVAVRTDPALLERVIANLVANAIEWSPSSVRIAATNGGDRVRLAIVDHGPGIEPDQRLQVRQPFQRRGDARSGGVGLGLAIADQMATTVGGTLALAETPGGGLTAIVELPASDAG